MEKLALSIGGAPINAPGGIPTESSGTTISTVLGVGFSVLVGIGIIATLFYLIWGGIDWITSEGDKQKVNQARTKIGFAIIGLVIIFASFLIIQTITHIFLGSSLLPCPVARGRALPC